MKPKGQISGCRQRLGQSLSELEAVIQQLQSERGELIPASLYRRSRSCGKKRCRCKRGAMHESLGLNIRKEGQSKWVSLEGLNVLEIEKGVAAYRRYRRRRTELLKCFKEIITVVDTLAEQRQRDVAALVKR